MNKIMQLLFGCAHERTTWPITLRVARARTYIVCLDCGREFEYNWKAMEVVRGR